MFVMIVDDFGIEYVGKKHLDHLRQVLTEHYTINEDLAGKNSGINLEWTYATNQLNRKCRLSMEGYIAELLLHYGHKYPAKTQISPHRCHEIIYGTTVQLSHKDSVSPTLTLDGICWVQAIIGTLLYYAHAVDKKRIVGLSAIGTQHAAAT